jgi:hypothetical protein
VTYFTASELAGRIAARDVAICARPQWGHWRFIPNLLVLSYRSPGGEYEIDLETCTTSAQVLDWIFQIHDKLWCRPQDRVDLLNALNWLLHPQANLCSWGEERGPIDVKAHLTARMRSD